MDFFTRLTELVGDALLPDDVREPLARASDALVRGDYPTAQLEALAALDKRRDLPRAHLVLGLARRGLGDLEGARAALREALRRAPGDGAAHLALAECELTLGDARRALREALRARDAGIPQADVALILARAHLARSEAREAQAALEALPESQRPLESLPLLGRLRLEAGDAAGAEAAFRESLSRGAPSAEALAGLARSLFAQGRLAEALPLALQALSEAPTDPKHAVLVGDLHARAGNHAAACAAYERAAELDRRCLEALRGAAASLEALGETERSLERLERALEVDPGDREAARARARIEERRRLAAESAAREAGALAEARAALRPDDLYALLVRLHRWVASAPGLEDLAGRVAGMREGYDRPLLLAIAGEFNAGKSTLLNALLGDAVAPMGVTPTTAAVNVFLYGNRRAARVVQRDGSATEVAFAEVEGFIDRRRGAGDAAVRHVEIVWPAEALRDVSLVDTPGFNAAEEEHEAVAREFLARADAVLWLFDASHAGTASERAAIEALGPLRGKLLGVLNKADWLSPDDLAQVTDRLRDRFAGEVADWVAVSARDALEARRTGETGRLGASGFDRLWAALEARFFARARAVKRETTQARAGAILAEARARARGTLEAAAEAVRAADGRRRGAAEVAARLARDLAPALEEEHRGGMHRLVGETARDALDVASRRGGGLAAWLPTSMPDADLDYLARLIGDRIRGHLDDLCERAAREVARHGRAEAEAWREAPAAARSHVEALLAVVARTLEDVPADLRAGPFGHAEAYARGWLDGGRLRGAAPALGKAKSAQEARAALERSLPTALPWREPFDAWARGFAHALEEVAAEAHRRAEAARAEAEMRLGEPLAELERALAALGAASSEA
jgi:tetratricopeptide (TPR) repeat protein